MSMQTPLNLPWTFADKKMNRTGKTLVYNHVQNQFHIPPRSSKSPKVFAVSVHGRIGRYKEIENRSFFHEKSCKYRKHF